MLLLQNSADNLQTWYLSHWAAQYKHFADEAVSAVWHISTYTSILLGLFVFQSVAFLVYGLGTLQASRHLHLRLINAVLGTTL
ncbi:ABC transporter [Mycena chlorophos]|uniref:ABC transporter n=1 Tax=Mycena chlorophos TaxID=658473 RepID=A0A8H6TNP1_MYCCL|nr:ABC transporter [Mycena chlorophos]